MIKILMHACMCFAFLKSVAQNNDIFKGGAGDGYYKDDYTQFAANISKGGNGDGHSMEGYTQNSILFWKGGPGDGHSAFIYNPSIAPIWNGGNGDGIAAAAYIQQSFNFMRGGNGDGYSAGYFTQADESLWLGGQGDGWASTYLPYQLLPVNMLSFEAEKIQNRFSRLTWTTTGEINSDHFEIQRSTDAIHFSVLGTVKAAGNATANRSYHFTDSFPETGINYYRLKQVDNNGKFVYSPSKMVRFDRFDNPVRVYPQPAGNWMVIEMPGKSLSENTVINISDMKGNVLSHFRLTAGSSSVYRVNVSNLPRASYILHISSASYNRSRIIVLQ